MPSDLLIFLTPSRPTSSGIKQDDLRLLPEFFLQGAARQVVERLVLPAHLDVGLDGDAVIGLGQRVQQLVQADRLALRRNGSRSPRAA